MSLDIELLGDIKKEECHCCGHVGYEREVLFEANITHNLSEMVEAAGIYMSVWRPDELGIKKAGDLIQTLKVGIAKMKSEPDHFKQYSAENGWGTYDQFIPWIEKLLDTCEKYPEAVIEVSK